MATTELNIYHRTSGSYLGKLVEVDVHGDGRRNHAWDGRVRGVDIDLPNLKAVRAWCRKNDFEFIKTVVSE